MDPAWKKKKVNTIQAKQVESDMESGRFSPARFTLSSASLKKHQIWDEETRAVTTCAPWTSPTIETTFELAVEALEKEKKKANYHEAGHSTGDHRHWGQHMHDEQGPVQQARRAQGSGEDGGQL